MKVVINTCYGGFELSEEALKMFNTLKWEEENIEDENMISRTDEELLFVIDYLKEKANGNFADLKIVEIPDGIEWTIEEYDGVEWIAEKHRTWS